MSKDQIFKVLRKYVPEPSLSYCTKLWEDCPFHFTVTKKRSTKYGDYRFLPEERKHKITVNGDLNKYAFLVTYIHEYAHLLTVHRFGNKTEPHGSHWKNCFVEVMQPLLTEGVFPADILSPLTYHMRNPKASSASDFQLVSALRRYDGPHDLSPIVLIDAGKRFRLNDRIFVRQELRRTRFICIEDQTKRKYLVSKTALVEPLPV